MTWREIPGQGDDIPPFLDWLGTVLPPCGRFVEVGCFLGRSLAYMGALRPDVDLWAVDSWTENNAHQHHPYRDAHGGTMWRAFMGGMREHAPDVLDRLHVVRGRSCDVAVPDADAIFIDAGHDYPDISADLAHWTIDVRSGGILSGHDFGHVDVARAVREMFGEPRIGPGENSQCWWVRR